MANQLNFGNDAEQELYSLQENDIEIIVQQANEQETQYQNNQLDPGLIINECKGQFKTVVTTGNTQNVLGDNQIEVEKQQNKGNQQKHYKFELTMLIEIMKNLKDPQNKKILMDKNLIFQVQQYIENNQEKKENFQYNIIIKQDSDLQSNYFKQYPHIITMHIDFQLPLENELFLLENAQTQTISYWNNNKKKDETEIEFEETEFKFKKIGYLFHFENITKLDKLESNFKQKCQKIQQEIEQLKNKIQQKQNNSDKNDQIELQSLQQQLLYEEFEFKYYDIALYPMSGSFKNQSVLLKRSRYQQNQQTELIAQKTFRDLQLSDILRLLNGQIKDELDDRKPEGNSVNVEREIKFIYDLKKKGQEHDLIIKLKGFVVNKTKKQAKINLEYFGGIEFNGSTVNDFFYAKKYHQDLGCENFEQIEYFLSQIFFQAVEGVEIFHKSQKVLRDFKDDNILMIRINNDEVRCKLIDFGLTGNLDSNLSHEFYSKNDFRDNEICKNYNYKQNKIYYAAYDIYSLGIFLQKLYLLYFYCFRKRYQGEKNNPIVDFDLAKQLVSIMTAKRSQRPESIEILKQTDEYKNYFTQKFEEYHTKKQYNQQNVNQQQQQSNEIQFEQLQINEQQQ